MPNTTLALVGDSDIAFWPNELHPKHTSLQDDDDTIPIVSGHPGACLIDVVPKIAKIIAAHGDALILVACAGENDIGSGMSLDSTLQAMDRLLHAVFDSDETTVHLIFLGPKLEPWLQHDASSRKAYSKMSRALQRACTKHANADRIRYIDCLLMFCGASAGLPGAVHGGKAVAESRYFASDELHLSDEGYGVWKEVVENAIEELASGSIIRST